MRPTHLSPPHPSLFDKPRIADEASPTGAAQDRTDQQLGMPQARRSASGVVSPRAEFHVPSPWGMPEHRSLSDVGDVHTFGGPMPLVSATPNAVSTVAVGGRSVSCASIEALRSSGSEESRVPNRTETSMLFRNHVADALLGTPMPDCQLVNVPGPFSKFAFVSHAFANGPLDGFVMTATFRPAPAGRDQRYDLCRVSLKTPYLAAGGNPADDSWVWWEEVSSLPAPLEIGQAYASVHGRAFASPLSDVAGASAGPSHDGALGYGLDVEWTPEASSAALNLDDYRGRHQDQRHMQMHSHTLSSGHELQYRARTRRALRPQDLAEEGRLQRQWLEAALDAVRPDERQSRISVARALKKQDPRLDNHHLTEGSGVDPSQIKNDPRINPKRLTPEQSEWVALAVAACPRNISKTDIGYAHELHEYDRRIGPDGLANASGVPTSVLNSRFNGRRFNFQGI